MNLFEVLETFGVPITMCIAFGFLYGNRISGFKTI